MGSCSQKTLIEEFEAWIRFRISSMPKASDDVKIEKNLCKTWTNILCALR